MNQRPKLHQRSEKLEDKSHELIYQFCKRLLRSVFAFKKRKGEFSAATVTFFTLMSFTPMLLFTIALYGQLIGDHQAAYQQIFSTLKGNFPNLAPWILKSLQNIIKAKMTSQFDFSMGGILLLLYACFGFTSALNYGIHRMAKMEPRGGKLFEDARSIFSSVLMGGFILGLIYVTSGGSSPISKDMGILYKIYRWGLEKNIWQGFAALTFFTLYYKWLAPIRVRYQDAFAGALSFLMLFFAGKTFYWVYLKFAQEEMINNFGNFYTMTEAVIWIYFLSCAFFYSATVAFDQVSRRKKLQAPPSSEGTPEFIPKAS
jgi:membrane protein